MTRESSIHSPNSPKSVCLANTFQKRALSNVDRFYARSLSLTTSSISPSVWKPALLCSRMDRFMRFFTRRMSDSRRTETFTRSDDFFLQESCFTAKHAFFSGRSLASFMGKQILDRICSLLRDAKFYFHGTELSEFIYSLFISELPDGFFRAALIDDVFSTARN